MRSGGTDDIRWRDHAVLEGTSAEHTLTVKPIGGIPVEHRPCEPCDVNCSASPIGARPVIFL
jgi:hypothetical protein